MKKRMLIAALALMLPAQVASADQSALEFLKDIEVNGMLDTYYSYNMNRPETRTDVGGGQETSRFRSFDKEDNSLTVDNFELMFQKSREIAETLLRHGYREPVEVVKRA